MTTNKRLEAARDAVVNAAQVYMRSQRGGDEARELERVVCVLNEAEAEESDPVRRFVRLAREQYGRNCLGSLELDAYFDALQVAARQLGIELVEGGT